jgi:uracil-DNA glycosylase
MLCNGSNGGAKALPSEDVASLRLLNQEVIECFRCPRLVAHREQVARVQRRAYRGQQYWARPVPGFGDPAARLVMVGLAPAAHGANRTGRMFTGDRSGEFLYRALWETQFASRPESISSDDGLRLVDAYITAAARCAPPDNKPTRDEMLNCRTFLARELALLTDVRVVLALGGIALDAYLSVLQDRGLIRSRAQFRFAHGGVYRTHEGGPIALASYHPSQQNTSTKRLTREMLRDVLLTARQLIAESERCVSATRRAAVADDTSQDPTR